MKEIKVVGWTNFDSFYQIKDTNGNELDQMIQILKDEIIKNRYRFSGEDHQYSQTGMPVFSNGSCLRMSMRAWGSLMASIYSKEEVYDFTYMDFYVSTEGERKLPELKPIEVEPLNIEQNQIGLVVEADNKVLSETILMGMEFVTNDKVLNKYYQILKEEQER